jgi:DNA-binding response OmpR family regulator
MALAERILIIEDEQKIARVLELELQFEGYDTGVAYTGTDGLIMYREQSWDLILLDVMLPEMNGLDVLKRIRATEFDTPVLLLTAKDAVSDKVTGLDLGANDYITKPFEMEELLARIRMTLRFRKKETVDDDQYEKTIGDVTVHTQMREVKWQGNVVDLTKREFELLLYFMEHPKQVLTREQILDAVWGYDYYGDTNVVDVYVRYLRQKLDAKFIQTVRGVGYVLKE